MEAKQASKAKPKGRTRKSKSKARLILLRARSRSNSSSSRSRSKSKARSKSRSKSRASVFFASPIRSPKSGSKSKPKEIPIKKKPTKEKIVIELKVKRFPRPLTLDERETLFNYTVEKVYGFDSNTRLNPSCIPHKSAMLKKLDSKGISALNLYEQGQAIVEALLRQNLVADEFIRKHKHLYF